MRNTLRILLTGALLLSAPAVAGAAGVRLASLPVAGSAPVRAPFAFDLVGARWRGSGRVELRSRSESGPWSSWALLPAGEDVRPGRGVSVSEPVWTGSGRVVQLRAARAEWGADESMRRAAPLYAPSVQMVFVHHTATSNDYTESQVPSILRSIYAYHVQANGWNDIGYNYLV